MPYFCNADAHHITVLCWGFGFNAYVSVIIAKLFVFNEHRQILAEMSGKGWDDWSTRGPKGAPLRIWFSERPKRENVPPLPPPPPHTPHPPPPPPPPPPHSVIVCSTLALSVRSRHCAVTATCFPFPRREPSHASGPLRRP